MRPATIALAATTSTSAIAAARYGIPSASSGDEAVSGALLGAIQGRGAFRYFKDQVRERGLAESWYEFRAGRYRQIALDWCKRNGLELDTGA